ncbi:SagB family peptide dehydrogenase [Arachnia propionica]|uniref:SagB/ThcOx family dehydrogenase n=1 Tax=Arachnia propionica TaxID=1750 RepID=A0A3P1WVP3_9ACTN|nr:SagB family peptide dehydrogenase [Arachnia propionica]RRD50704.1 SagB/ThcOx family dehydrogenase [Arachnia propionica]
MQKLQVVEGVSLRRDGDDLVIIGGGDEQRLRLGQEAAHRLARFNGQPVGLDELSLGLLTVANGMQILATLTSTIRSLVEAGYVTPVMELDGQIIAKLCKKGYLPWQEGSAPEGAVVSPLVMATHDHGWVVLDSGLGCGLVRMLPAFAGPVLAGEELGPGERLAPLRELLWKAGLLVLPEAATSMEQTMWNPAELLMMQRSNDSAANVAYGATYRYVDTRSPLPLVEPVDAETVVELPVPAPERWAQEDEPFGVVTERRRSVSSFSTEKAPTLRQLAGVLHRAARFQQRFVDDKGTEVARRPAAAGGALHELDLYLAVDRLDGLDAGLWRFNPAENVLERVNCQKDPAALVKAATASVWSKATPPVTVILVARFGRVMWKYEGVGGALVLKNAGVMLHALQLAAVAEGLGACALGGNSARVFEEVTGLGLPSHGPVGQLVLGVEQG